MHKVPMDEDIDELVTGDVDNDMNASCDAQLDDLEITSTPLSDSLVDTSTSAATSGSKLSESRGTHAKSSDSGN